MKNIILKSPMTRPLLCLALAVTILCTSLSAFAAAASDTVQAMAGAITSQYGAASVQYALVDQGEVTISGHAGVYSKSENLMLTDEHLYGIGSVSKMYTTAAALKLVEQGKLDLDQPVVQYLPEFKMADPRYTQITPRMLLNHSSGLPGSSTRNAFLFQDNDTFAHDQLLNALAAQTLKADPGAFSVYCNDGFTLMELTIEKITGMTFSQFLRDSFFTPMALENTFTSQEPFDTKKLAKLYAPAYQTELPMDTVNIIGTGGIYSSAEELCRFSQLFMGDFPELLPTDLAQKTQAREYQNGIWLDETENSVAYGLGWDSVDLYPFGQYGIKALCKGGDTLYSHAALVVLPEHHLAAAVLSSGGSSVINTALANNLLLEALLEKGIIDEIKPDQTFEPAQQQEMPKELEAYSGLYGASGGLSNVIVKDNELRIPAPEGTQIPDQVYPYVGGNKFQSLDGSMTLSFSDEANGQTYLVLSAYSTLPGLGQTYSSTYNCQKVDPNPISQELQELWQPRLNKQYYLLNEKYTSQLFTLPIIQTITGSTDLGYVMGCKIVDENNAVNIFQIPIINGRDSFDVRFHQEDGKELVTIKDGVYLSQDHVPAIWPGDSSVCTIQPSGHSRWFRVSEESAGKTMTVSLPPNSAFSVYDGNGANIANTVVTGSTSVTLPANGSIVFSGSPGAVFLISLQ